MSNILIQHEMNKPLGGVNKAAPHYASLDLLRGVAAICVLLYHTDFLFDARGVILPKAYLCVDFFFALSGFVIAANYSLEARPKILFRQFLIARLARLWPLLAASVSIGFFVMGAKLYQDFHYLDTLPLIGSVAFNALMLPSFFQPYSIDRLYIFNGAAWSIFFELMINIVYFVFFRRLLNKYLLIVLLVSWCALFWSAFSNHGLDVGWSSQNFIYGFARVFYSFILGLVIFSGRVFERFRVSAFWLVSMAILFVFTLQFDLGWIYDLVIITLVFPVILIVSVNSNVVGKTKAIAQFIGDISYSVYLLQTPSIVLFSGLSVVFWGAKIGVFTPTAGYVFLMLFIPCCYFCWRFFEMPSQWAIKAVFINARK
ncbi:MAG: acyltransferase [Methylobacter sp.]|uniref:acyltransferase family protein n=1 Tax=Methylobacter sp. TaxID=2051955 RepID=UPI0027308A8F|nr:acyltransferase [Methylobacter sp.]MDP1664539.1 acyltransferase [Methylobacter sp.]